MGGVAAFSCGALLVAMFIRLAFASPDWTDDCPTACRCKWSSGKKTALCRDAGFTALPATLSGDMQVLDLSGNAIPYLTKDAFRSVGLINLQRIFVRNARVREIHKDAFRDLLILVEVDLSENLVTTIHPETFIGNMRLKVLCLNGNPLRELRDMQFPSLPHLRTIDLENCQLASISRDAFAHVIGLESLNLKNNRLSELSADVFTPIPRLNTLLLDGNPWKCDCRLRGFRNWLLASKLHPLPLACSEPAPLALRVWQDVPSEKFACAPQVSLTSRIIRADFGDNITFGCHVRGDPEPEVTWYFDGRVIGSGNATHPDQVLLIEVEEGLLDKWINISLFNVSDLEAGEYSCVAKNIQGSMSRNVTLILPEVVVVSTVTKSDSWLLWLALMCGGVAILCSTVIAIVCACCLCGRQRRRKRHRRKAKLKGSVSFTDQEKKLLDVSITTTDRGPSAAESCEVLGASQPEMEMMEQSPSIPLELCEPPVHITIESRNPDSSGGVVPMSGPGSTSDYPATLGVFPPPPEFSTSILPAGAFGNIFISVSVSQDPNLDIQRYPDLLDIPNRSKASATGVGQGVSVGTGTEDTFCTAKTYATLPRRQLRPVVEIEQRRAKPHYDNMGPRVTAGGSCSTLSLPDADGNVIPEDIPPPPPPPICSPHAGEFVSL